MKIPSDAHAPRALVLETRIPGGRAEVSGFLTDPSLSDDEHAESFRKHMAGVGHEGAVEVVESTTTRLHLALTRRDG